MDATTSISTVDAMLRYVGELRDSGFDPLDLETAKALHKIAEQSNPVLAWAIRLTALEPREANCSSQENVEWLRDTFYRGNDGAA